MATHLKEGRLQVRISNQDALRWEAAVNVMGWQKADKIQNAILLLIHDAISAKPAEFVAELERLQQEGFIPSNRHHPSILERKAKPIIDAADLGPEDEQPEPTYLIENRPESS